MRRAVVLAVALAMAGGGAASAQRPALDRQDTWEAQQADLTRPTQQAGRGGLGITVAVLDTWVDVAHPDLQGRASAGAECIDGTCRAGQTRDACDHGTHVAGTIASSSYGAAPEATLLPIQVLQFDKASGACLGEPQDVAAGIRYALARGARVINLSLGADIIDTDDGPLPEAVRAAANAGTVIVLSAGNGEVPVGEPYGDEALVVAATDASGALADYSQRGRGVDLAAPGGDALRGACSASSCVTSLFPDGRYALAAGTSMSAPLVSGVAALLLAQRPDRTSSDVTELLTGTTKPLAGAGGGLLDASAALGVTAAVPRPPDTVPFSLAPPQATTSNPSGPGGSRIGPDPVSLKPISVQGGATGEVPIGLSLSALLLILGTGAAATIVSRRREPPGRRA